MDTTTKTILLNLSRLEQLGTKRAAIMSLVESDLKGIDSEKKESKEKLRKAFASYKDVSLAVSTANALVPIIKGASDADRKRLSRRRSTVIDCLKAEYNDYDFEVVKGRSGGQILSNYVGSKERREAFRLERSMKDFCMYLGIKLPKYDIDELEAAIKGSNIVSVTNLDMVMAEVAPVDFALIAERINGIVSLKEEEAKKVKIA